MKAPMPDKNAPHAEPEWATKLRAAGYGITAGTADTLAEPEYVMPPRVAPRGVGGITARVRRFWQTHRIVRVKDAALP
jgi:hypothetical protein